jgi:hypothetical protein
LAGWLLLAGAAGLAYAAYRFVLRRGKSSKSGPARMDLRPEALALKARIRSAGAAGASKDILTSMEALAIRHMLQELGPPQAGDPAGVKFDPLLDRYLARNAGPGGSAGAATDWNALRDLFRHARFAGGHKEPHELQDAYRVFRKCLQITDEPGED